MGYFTTEEQEGAISLCNKREQLTKQRGSVKGNVTKKYYDVNWKYFKKSSTSTYTLCTLGVFPSASANIASFLCCES